jgi:hypothetical protein
MIRSTIINIVLKDLIRKQSCLTTLPTVMRSMRYKESMAMVDGGRDGSKDGWILAAVVALLLAAPRRLDAKMMVLSLRKLFGLT